MENLNDTENGQPGEPGEPLSPEAAAELAEMARSIADEPMPGADGSEPECEVVVNAGQVRKIAGVLFTIGKLASMKYPALSDVFTKKRCDEVAGDLAPVFVDLGWSVTGGKVGMYLTAAISLFMLGGDAREAVRASIKEMEDKEMEDALSAN